MVDFSDRESIEPWLTDIAPDRRRAVAVALATREALRVVPLLRVRVMGPLGSLGNLVLPSLRATAAAWAAAKYPAHGGALRVWAAAAAAAATPVPRAKALGTSITAHPEATGIIQTIAAQDAAAGAAHAAAAPPSRSAHAAAVVASVAVAAFKAVTVATSAAYALSNNAVAQDAAFVDSGYSGAELVGLPLWRDGRPEWAYKAWYTLKAALLDEDEGWEVWTDWYEARLARSSAERSARNRPRDNLGRNLEAGSGSRER
jgi:hypothetical protein